MAGIYSYHDEEISFSFSRTEQPDPEQFRMHAHPNMELYYFSSGRGIFHIEGSAYPMEAGDVLLMRPAESHYIELDPSESYERFSIHFSPQLLQGIDPDSILLQPFFDRKSGKQNLFKAHSFRGGSARHYFDTMTRGDAPRISVLAGLIPLLHEIRNSFYSNTNPSEPEGDTIPYRIVRYLNKNLSRQITLDDICREFYISRSQLCRLFRDATGTTVKHYLTVKRLINAKRRIEAGELATHIYLELGFNDYSSFYRAYVKHFGAAPSEK